MFTPIFKYNFTITHILGPNFNEIKLLIACLDPFGLFYLNFHQSAIS